MNIGKVIEFVFVGGFRDGQILTSNNSADIAETSMLWKWSDEGTIGKAFRSASEAAHAILGHGAMRVGLHPPHLYTIVDRTEDDTTIRIVLEHSVIQD